MAASETVSRLLGHLEKPKRGESGWTAACPAHEDDMPSLSIGEGDDGRVLLNCHAGCSNEEVVSALGLELSDLFPESNDRPGGRGYAVADYAADKGLPEAFLRSQFDVRTRREPGRRPVVAIPYQGPNGETIRTRYRTADKFWWAKDGDGVALYGLGRLADADPSRSVLLVEGESDCHVCAFHGVLAAGVPGASSWRSSWTRHVAERDVFVWMEPDHGGDTLVADVAADLPRARVIEAPDDAADPSDLHEAVDGDTDRFRVRLGELIQAARPIREVAADQAAATTDESSTDTGGSGEKEEKTSQKDALLTLTADLDLFSTDRDVPYARIRREDHVEVWPVRSSRFRAWLAHQYHDRHGGAPTASTVADVLQVLEGRARFDGPTRELHNRFARHDGALWYDLADNRWRAIRLDASGWELIEDPPPLFRRYAHQEPQVDPVATPAEELAQLLGPFLNVEQQADRLLLQVWIVTALLPDIPRPVLVPHGPQGSAKSCLTRLVLRLTDPSGTPMPRFPRGDAEMAQTLDHHAALGFDNLSTLSQRDSDTLCRAVTGDGFTKRKLYTDDEDVLYSFKRALVLNGINVPAQQPDLLDRSVLVRLRHIEQEDRWGEEELWSRFEAVRPRVFGAMLDALVRAHALEPDVDLATLPRMADWTRWGHAVADALGLGGTAFLRAYAANRADQTMQALVSHPVGAAVRAFMEERELWRGAPSELLAKLEEVAERESLDTTSKLWPGSASWLTRRLREVETNLRAAGIRYRRARDDDRLLVLRRHRRHSGDEKNADGDGDGSGPAQRKDPVSITATDGIFRTSDFKGSEGSEPAESAENDETPETPVEPGMEDAVGGRAPTNAGMEDGDGGDGPAITGEDLDAALGGGS